MPGKWILRTVLVLVCLAVLVIPPFAIGTASEFLVWVGAVAAVLIVSGLIHFVVERRTRES